MSLFEQISQSYIDKKILKIHVRLLLLKKYMHGTFTNSFIITPLKQKKTKISFIINY